MNGLEYKGTTLSASNKNDVDAIYIWDLKKTPQGVDSPHSFSPGERAAAPYAGYEYGYYIPANGNASPTEYSAYYGYDQSTVAPGCDSGYSSGASSSGYQYPADSSAHTATAMAPALPSPSYEGDGSAVPWYPSYSQRSYGHDQHQRGGASYSDTPKTLKIIVKNLSRHASHRELESYLLKAAGGKHKLQEAVRFPRLAATGSGRQHAFLLFKTHSDALTALHKLDHTKLLGLVIEARFATETVLPLHGPSSSAMYVPFVMPARTEASVSGTAGAGAVGAVAAAAVAASYGGASDSAGAHPPALTTSFTSASECKQESKPKTEKSYNLVVDGRSAYGRAKKAAEEATKTCERERKHKK